MRIMRDHRRWMIAFLSVWHWHFLSGRSHRLDFLIFCFSLPFRQTRPFEAGPGQMPRYGSGGADVRKRAGSITIRSRRIGISLLTKTNHPVRPHGPIDLMDDESLQAWRRRHDASRDTDFYGRFRRSPPAGGFSETFGNQEAVSARTQCSRGAGRIECKSWRTKRWRTEHGRRDGP